MRDIVTLSPLGYPRKSDPEIERRMTAAEMRMPHMFHSNEMGSERFLVTHLTETERRAYFAKILQHWEEQKRGEWDRYVVPLAV